jgi:DNA-binding beta-propeller fold protein YncE
MGSGDLGFNGVGLPSLETRLASPTSVRSDPDGRPVVIDYSNMRVRVLTESGTVETLVGNGYHGYSEIGVTALETPLENPVDAVWGPDGLLYVLPQHEGRVIVVAADGTIARVAGTGVLADTGDGGDSLDAEMGYGGGLAFADDGTLFVSDNSFSRIRRFGTDGIADTVLGVGSGGPGELGYGPETSIWSPERVVVDGPRNRLLVPDSFNHRVLALDLETLTVTLIAGSGERGYSGDGGPAELAELHNPVGIEVTAEGTVLIADLENNVLRAVFPDGIIETVAGTGAVTDISTVEDPLAFHMRRPAGLAWASGGDLLIAERSGHRVLRWLGAADAL